MGTRKFSIAIICLFGILFATSCEQQNSANLDLNDSWKSTSGNGLIISGTSGTLYEFSASWQVYESEGLVSLGDLGLQNISKTSTYSWTCLQKTMYILGGVNQYMIWSDNTSLTMSTDGLSFTTESNYTLPGGGTSSGTSTFYRQ